MDHWGEEDELFGAADGLTFRREAEAKEHNTLPCVHCYGTYLEK